jgi:hypothetical protein
MVAVVIIKDDGEMFLMGKSEASAIECAVKAATRRKYKYISDQEQRLQYLARAVEVMEGK